MKKSFLIITIVTLILSACEKVCIPHVDNTNSGITPIEKPQDYNRDGVSITITKSSEDVSISYLCPNKGNTISLPFSIHPAVKNIDYEIVCASDVIYNVEFNADGSAGVINVQSSGDLEKKPFNIGLKVTEKGENITPVWTDITNWTITPAFLEVCSITPVIDAINGTVELSIETNLQLELSVNSPYGFNNQSIHWENNHCTFKLNDNCSTKDINCYITLASNEYPMRADLTVIQKGRIIEETEKQEGDGGVDIIIDENEDGGNQNIEF